MKNIVMYTSENGQFRVLYCPDDLGKKYRVQQKCLDVWHSVCWTDFASDALKVMKIIAGEWRM